jgi:outer membrane lipoprotein-sorting protein
VLPSLFSGKKTYYPDMKKLLVIIIMLLLCIPPVIHAQDAEQLVQRVKAKIALVNDYTATGKMKTNVSFLKVPVANVVIWFKKPDQLRIKNEKGISFVPKGVVSINLNNVLGKGSYTLLDAGVDKVAGIPVRVVKLLPADDNAEVVLSTLYIDEARQVILRSKTTTRESGSYELEMSYGKYVSFGLPDKIIFSFNTKEYKLPKGMTFDFDDGTPVKQDADKAKSRKGRAEITISTYSINKGIADSVFR